MGEDNFENKSKKVAANTEREDAEPDRRPRAAFTVRDMQAGLTVDVPDLGLLVALLRRMR
jgi:hypothetical protein